MKTLKVLLYGRQIGTLALLPSGFCSFEYTAEFCRSGMEPSPLHMPAVEGRVYMFPNLARETFIDGGRNNGSQTVVELYPEDPDVVNSI